MRSVDERTGDSATEMKAACNNLNATLRVAMPGIVQAFNAAAQTVSVQIAIREKMNQDNSVKDVDLPLLVDVPVVMPRAGGYSLVFAPKKGDECLVMFADVCIDAWWQSGGVQNQAELRRHDFSDGFAILGVWRQPRKCKMPNSGVRLQNDEGTAGVEVNGKTVNLFGTVTANGKTIVTE